MADGRGNFGVADMRPAPAMVHTRGSTVRPDVGQAHAAPLSPDAQFRGPETRAAIRIFRRPARFGSTPVAGQVLRMDAIGRLTAPPLVEVDTATISVCGSTSRGILPNSETCGFLLDTFSGPSPTSFRTQRTERGARYRGFAPQTPPPVSAPCIVLSALSVAA